jgi:diketogulonate reductase-like aldo/keto reductase
VHGEGLHPKDSNGKPKLGIIFMDIIFFFFLDKVPVEVTWVAMEDLVVAGLAKSIGLTYE